MSINPDRPLFHRRGLREINGSASLGIEMAPAATYPHRHPGSSTTFASPCGITPPPLRGSGPFDTQNIFRTRHRPPHRRGRLTTGQDTTFPFNGSQPLFHRRGLGRQMDPLRSITLIAHPARAGDLRQDRTRPFLLTTAGRYFIDAASPEENEGKTLARTSAVHSAY